MSGGRKHINCNCVTSTTKRGTNTAVMGYSFCTLLKLSWYKFKVECYNVKILKVVFMITTMKKATEYKHKETR